VPIRDWLITYSVAWSVVGRYDGVAIIPAGGHGTARVVRGGSVRLQGAYPPGLVRTRPRFWGPCEHSRTSRDHERAAFDIAGAALDRLDQPQLSA
jgi:hypothetical protein